jgi:ethanolamine ammonia-lyase small subunit
MMGVYICHLRDGLTAMTLHIDIDDDVPVPDKDDLAGQKDLIETARAAAAAANMLSSYGLEIEETEEDLKTASALATQYAKDPMSVSQAATPARISNQTPAALRITAEILNRFGHSIVKDAVQVRHMVTNKLIEETENPDPRIRLRALELLGKITDVGLFTERSEVTVTHQTTDDIREKLRAKLNQMKDVTPASGVEDVEFLDE